MRRLATLLVACTMVAASSAVPAFAQTTPTHSSFNFPFEFSQTNPCSGEFIQFSGRFSGEVTSFTDSGGNVHFTAHQLLTAGGLGSFGNRYSFTDTLDTSVHFASDSTAQTLTQSLVDHVIAQGNAPNFTLHSIFHETINANGEVTTITSEFTSECR
jgi:hypothetical protein